MIRLAGSLAFAAAALFGQPCVAQDERYVNIDEHKIRGLKGLRIVSVMVEQGGDAKIATEDEWKGFIEIGLRRHVPDLKVESKPPKPDGMVMLHIITAEHGSVLEMALYRWVRVQGSGANQVAKVWWNTVAWLPTGTGTPPRDQRRKDVQESIDSMLIKFGADYLRANR